MLHPVGPQSSAVYWRRRLALLTAVLVLVVITVLVLNSNGSDHAASADGGSTHPSPSAHSSSAANGTTSSASPAGDRHAVVTAPARRPITRAHTSSPAAPPPAPQSSTPPAVCDPARLKVAAVVGNTQYRVGQQPILMLQVTNIGTTQCVQNLADSQVVLTVYNGESRVWSSHDCQVEPGTDARELAPGRPVRVMITWSGLSSQPKCAGTRQRVGAGSYTLYATLSGHRGTAAQFSIS
jgi:hypothetical protein